MACACVYRRYARTAHDKYEIEVMRINFRHVDNKSSYSFPISASISFTGTQEAIAISKIKAA
jgi:hypothetical protein